MNRSILLLAFAAVTLAAAPTFAQKKKVDPAGVAAVANCYRACYADYVSHTIHAEGGDGSRVIRHPGGDAGVPSAVCSSARAAIVGGSRCGRACNDIWTAYNKPPVKVRDDFRAEVADDETRYAAISACATNEPLDHGIRIID
ncbi:MAG: hypothetical protein F4Y04_05285 [Chloroflexi bacterium]|nr:hypothetical protein [Chloroflexota bacterium]